MICPVCNGEKSELFDQDKLRAYFKCLSCDLIFVPREMLISTSSEKKRYEAHENEENQNYSAYLDKIVQATTPHLSPMASGLDFGCGKTFLLSKLFGEAGFEVKSYDLFFHPDQSVFQDQYDFIILSEVIEHLRTPCADLLKLKNLLKPKGKFFIKTKLRPLKASEFSNWFYKRDSTHVQFFNETSFAEIARILGVNLPKLIGDDLFLFSR
jgi:SAM-dependent methyltransferase